VARGPVMINVRWRDADHAVPSAPADARPWTSPYDW